MQQVLKSRAFLHRYNSAATLRGAMDCGECDAVNHIEPMQTEVKTWGLCEYRTRRELLSIKIAIAVGVLAMVAKWWLG